MNLKQPCLDYCKEHSSIARSTLYRINTSHRFENKQSSTMTPQRHRGRPVPLAGAGAPISRSALVMRLHATVFVLLSGMSCVFGREQLPSFSKLRANYPGYARFGGVFHNHELVDAIGCDKELLLHDTSALRLSFTLNKIGGVHSLGKELIRLSKYGRDSVTGRDGLQYLYHPIAYGPYLADKYGYPTVSKLHELDPLDTKKNFWGKQGLLRVITYTKKANMPKGHVALWDCNHFHEARDWIAGHSLITVEFWESPDSDCSHMPDIPPPPSKPIVANILPHLRPGAKPAKLRHRHWEKRFIKKYYQLHKTLNTSS